MYVATIQCLNYRGQEFKQQFAVNDFDTSVPMEKVKVSKISIDRPLATYHHANLERPPLNSVLEKANVKVTVKPGSTSIISFEHVGKDKHSGIVMI